MHYCYTTIPHIKFDIPVLPFEFHLFNLIMSEGRRGRRPPLPPSNAPVIPVENAEGAPSTASDAEEVPLSHVDGEQTEPSGKGAVDFI